jgi:hypothetical protein
MKKYKKQNWFIRQFPFIFMSIQCGGKLGNIYQIISAYVFMHVIQFFIQLILWFHPVAMHGHIHLYWCEVWLQGEADTCDFLQLVQFVKTKAF